MAGKKRQVFGNFILFSIFLFLIILVVGSTAFIFSMRQVIRTSKGEELIRTLELKRIELENSVNTKVIVAVKMAESPLILRHFTEPENAEVTAMALEEINSYHKTLVGNIFWINDNDKLFYFDDLAPYIMDPDLPENYWYNMTLHDTEVYNFNINYNPDLNMINLWINAPVFDTHGKPIGMVGSGIDITEFVSSIYEKNLGNTEMYFFNSLGEITVAMDMDLVVNKEHIDKKMSEIGLLAKALDLKPGETKLFDSPAGRAAIATVPVLEWYSVAIIPDSIDDFRNPVAVVFIIMLAVMALVILIFNLFIRRFLMSLNETMISLENARNEAEEASRSKSNFLAIMSHEIRTPLNAIIGISQIEMHDRGLSDMQLTAHERIHNSGNNLLGIINDILDMSKIETGKLELNPIKYDVPSLINDAVQLNIIRIGSKPIEFKLEINENLPSKLYGDELRLKQILNNLLSNAIKYTEKGYVKLTVDFEAINGSVLLRFIVEDTGQGIKSEDKERMFSEYLRFNAEANRSTEGTGLGLNITKKLVEMMDGTIEMESEYGKGSAFTVTVKQESYHQEGALGYLPIGAELAQKLSSFSFTVNRQPDNIQFSREIMPYGRVLVVDDVDTNLYVAEGLLTPYKLSIDMADSGFAAIEKIESGNTYDIIFMDHMMPQMDGIETTKKIREWEDSNSRKPVPIVALTANALAGNEEMFKKEGFDEFIPKPINIKQLNTILNKYIRDANPEEAKKYKPEIVPYMAMQAELINPKIIQVFCEDAEKAIVTLRETVSSGNINLFSITAHAMKSALANVGEQDVSNAAAELENAVSRSDMEYINANTEIFIKMLEGLIEKLRVPEICGEEHSDIINEDTAYLTGQLKIIRAACEDYDDDTAYAALDKLKEKKWSEKTTGILEHIRDMLFIYSDFNGVVQRINEFTKID